MLAPLMAIIIDAPDADGLSGGLAGALFSWLPAGTPTGRLAWLLALFAALMAMRSLVILRRDIALKRLETGFVDARRLSLARQLAATSWQTVNRLRHARVAHLLGADIQRCAIAAHFVVQCGVALALLAFQVALAFVLSPLLAAFSLAMLAALAAIMIPLARRSHAAGGEASAGAYRLTRDTAWFLGGLKQAFSHNREGLFVERTGRTLEDLRRLQIADVRRRTGARMILAAVIAAVGGATLLVGHGVLHLAPAVLIAVIVVLARTSGPATQIQQGVLQLATALPAYEEITALEAELAAARRPVEGVDEPDAPDRWTPVVFEQVGFSHVADAGDAPDRGLRDIGLALEAGEFVGLTGPSGAGKTTFADLLAGLFPPDNGRVTVGGRSLTGAVLRAWRDRIAYVPQDPFLFHDTLRANLLWGAPGATPDRISDALAVAGADDLVRRMPHGLDTVIGERGSQLSGGERQRLAIAAAVLRLPDVVILDEATSA
ncbi:MAG: ATP-binding cassette domain-containing protein, partial [Pseudomonadota bacterium]